MLSVSTRSNCEEHALVVPLISYTLLKVQKPLHNFFTICQMFLCSISLPTTYHPITLLKERVHCLFNWSSSGLIMHLISSQEMSQMWVHLLFHFKISFNFQTCKTSARKGRILRVILLEWIWGAAGAGGSLQYYYIQICEAPVSPRLALGSSWAEVPPILYAAISAFLIEMLLSCLWWSIFLQFFSHMTVMWTSGYFDKRCTGYGRVGFWRRILLPNWLSPRMTCGKSTSQIVAILTVPKLHVYLSWSPDIDY